MNKLKNFETTKRYEFMVESAVALGDLALQLVKGDVEMWLKPDSTKVTSVDLALNDKFISLVADAFPTDLVWGEEASNSDKGNLALADQDWMWTLDPIDGTSGFWRSYQQRHFEKCTATTLISAFAPGETTPSLSAIYNPFQQQRMMLTADPNGAYYQTSSSSQIMPVRLQGGPTRLDQVRRFENNDWPGATPDLTVMQDMMPHARKVYHQLFMAAVALGDVDVTAYPGPSNPHDVAPVAHMVHQADGTICSLKGEEYKAIDWRIHPIHGVLAAATPELADEFLAEMKVPLLPR